VSYIYKTDEEDYDFGEFDTEEDARYSSHQPLLKLLEKDSDNLIRRDHCERFHSPLWANP